MSQSAEGQALGFKAIDEETAEAFKRSQRLRVNFQEIGDQISILAGQDTEGGNLLEKGEKETALRNTRTNLLAPLRDALEGIAGKSAADITQTEMDLLAGTGVTSGEVRAAQGDREAMTALVDKIRDSIVRGLDVGGGGPLENMARERIGSIKNITSQRGQQAENAIAAALSSNTQGTKIEDINFSDVSKFLQTTGQLARTRLYRITQPGPNKQKNKKLYSQMQ